MGKRNLIALGMLLLSVASASAAPGLETASAKPTIETSARQVILIDMNTDRVLFEKNADQRMPTSSMSKIMTMYMVFEALKEGRLKPDSMLTVSQSAWGKGGATGGSEMFLPLNSQVKVEDLIRGTIVSSGNDATVVLAEGLAGSEGAFAERMTERAKKLGLTSSNFRNASGLPDPDHYSTARDLALLAEHLIRDFPEDYHYFSEREFLFNKIKQGNRNPLLYRNIGVDGLKTGHTELAGYGLTASAERNGRRLVLVINGLPSMQARADESANILEYGFREFEQVALFRPGETVETAHVWLGQQPTVPLAVTQPVAATLSHEERKNLKVTVRMPETIKAPIQQEQQIATLVISAPGLDPREVPLVATAPVERLGLFGRIGAAISYLLSGPPKAG